MYDPGPAPDRICGHCSGPILVSPVYWLSDYPDNSTILYEYCSATCSLADYEETRLRSPIGKALPDARTLNKMIDNLLEKYDGSTG